MNEKETKADWLRSEIEKLEWSKITEKMLEQSRYSDGTPIRKPEIKQLIKWVNHKTTDSIITRYKEELKVLESK